MLLLFLHHANDIWEYEHKVAFDGPNKLILINSGVVDINVQTDIYSDWKEWLRLRDNAKYLQALRAVGGDALGGGESLGGQFFLINGWRCRTWEGDHVLDVNENLRVDENDPDISTKPNVFVPTLESHNIQINLAVSQITNVVTVEVSGSSSGSGGGFEESDRTILTSIETIVLNLPNSGSLTNMVTDIQSIVSASFVAAASVLSGSTSTTVRTTLTAPDDKFAGLNAVIKNGDGGEARQIDSYTLLSGTLEIYPPLSFTPQAGDSVVILPNPNFNFK